MSSVSLGSGWQHTSKPETTITPILICFICFGSRVEKEELRVHPVDNLAIINNIWYPARPLAAVIKYWIQKFLLDLPHKGRGHGPDVWPERVWCDLLNKKYFAKVWFLHCVYYISIYPLWLEPRVFDMRWALAMYSLHGMKEKEWILHGSYNSSWVCDHFLNSRDLNVWFRDDTVGRN